MSETVIEFDRVTKTYSLCPHVAGGIKTFLFHLPQAVAQFRRNKLTALDDVSFQLRRGQSLGVIGANGAGKSTTLALIAGVLSPTRGRISVRGRMLPLLELGAGFHPDLDGRENIMLNGVLMGLTRREVRARMDEIIAFSELGEFIDQPLRTYSSGMLGRLGFSVVAHLDPEVLLVDEVLTVGDASFQAKCLGRMQAFQRRGGTMVFVSHDMHAVRVVCEEALWLDHGRARMLGASAAVTAEYEASQTKRGEDMTPARPAKPPSAPSEGNPASAARAACDAFEQWARQVHGGALDGGTNAVWVEGPPETLENIWASGFCPVIYQHRREAEDFLTALLERGLTGTAVEIGLEHGGTHMLLRQVCRKVISVEAAAHKVLAFAARAPRDDRGVLIRGNSTHRQTLQAVERAAGGAVDLLFIDGSHAYEAVRSDYVMYRHLVRPGGIIAFHDTAGRSDEHRGVSMVLAELRDGRLDGVPRRVHDIIRDGTGISYQIVSGAGEEP